MYVKPEFRSKLVSALQHIVLFFVSVCIPALYFSFKHITTLEEFMVSSISIVMYWLTRQNAELATQRCLFSSFLIFFFFPECYKEETTGRWQKTPKHSEKKKKYSSLIAWFVSGLHTAFCAWDTKRRHKLHIYPAALYKKSTNRMKSNFIHYCKCCASHYLFFFFFGFSVANVKQETWILSYIIFSCWVIFH